MGRTPCCQKEGLKKGPWTVEEDQKLLAYIEENDHGSWRALPAKAGLQRCGKSCRLRWINYLRPDIKRGSFSMEEEETIIQFHALLGNRWSAIATHLPKRTDNEIKNYWNTHLKKRLNKMGIDPVTHKPETHSGRVLFNDHMGQSKDARVQAQDQTAREPHHQQHQPPTITTPTSASARLLNIVATRPAARSLCLDVLRAWQGIKSESITTGSSSSPGSSESESSSCTSSDELIRNSSCYFNGIWKENDGDEYWNGYDKSLTDLAIDDEWTFESVRTEINQEPDLNFADGFTEILLSHFDDLDS